MAAALALMAEEKSPEIKFHLYPTLDEGLSDSPTPSPKKLKLALDDNDIGTRKDELRSESSRMVRCQSVTPALRTSTTAAAPRTTSFGLYTYPAASGTTTAPRTTAPFFSTKGAHLSAPGCLLS